MNTEASGQHRMRLIGFQNLFDCRLIQSRARVPFAVSDTITLYRICYVLGSSAGQQVPWVDAGSVIARMAHVQILGRWAAICQCVGDTVRQILPVLSRRERRSPDYTVTIALLTTEPQPAFVRPAPIYPEPKFLCECRADRKGLGPLAECLGIARTTAKLLSSLGCSPARGKLVTANFAAFHTVIIAFFLTGCAASQPVIDTACDWVRPIMTSKDDKLTIGTARQILDHDDAWKKHCASVVDP